MKYSLDIDDDVSNAVYRMGLFDLSASGEDNSLNRFIKHLHLQVCDKAVELCTDVTPNRMDPEFNNGYVTGVKAVYDFILKSFEDGEAKRNKKPA